MIYTLEGVSQSYDILHELKKFKGHFLKVEKAHTYSYSASPLVVPKLNSYLVSWMGSNLVAPTSALP